MRVGTAIESMISAVYNATLKDLPQIQYKNNMSSNPERKVDSIRRPREEELEIYQFIQHWESTALGFNAMGGSTMSTAYTTVVFCRKVHVVCIYFAGQHAYNIDIQNNTDLYRKIHDAIDNQTIPSVMELPNFLKS